MTAAAVAAPAATLPKSRESALRTIRYYANGEPSPFGARVAELLDLWVGLHHIRDSALRKADWTDRRWIQLVYDQDLHTYDFNALTTLVFLAHALCIRVELRGCGPRYLRLSFSPRNGRAGGSVWGRHPSPERALEAFRAWFPIERDEPTSNDDPAATTEDLP